MGSWRILKESGESKSHIVDDYVLKEDTGIRKPALLQCKEVIIIHQAQHFQAAVGFKNQILLLKIVSKRCFSYSWRFGVENFEMVNELPLIYRHTRCRPDIQEATYRIYGIEDTSCATVYFIHAQQQQPNIHLQHQRLTGENTRILAVCTTITDIFWRIDRPLAPPQNLHTYCSSMCTGPDLLKRSE